MVIIKRSSGTYQVKFRGSDGFWITKSFESKRDAEDYELDLKRQKRSGATLSSEAKNINRNIYFESWFEAFKSQASPRWRKIQRQIYRDFIQPEIGGINLQAIKPPAITRVLNSMADKGRSRRHSSMPLGFCGKCFAMRSKRSSSYRSIQSFALSNRKFPRRSHPI